MRSSLAVSPRRRNHAWSGRPLASSLNVVCCGLQSRMIGGLLWVLEIERPVMRDRHLGSALKEIRALYSVGTQSGLTDGDLLELFVTDRGEASEFAFSTIVRRHGPMVLRVCQQRLSDVHQSQDAFQSTFLVLVKKAGSLRDRGSLGPWLFGVANRVAAKSRTAAARRTRHERR